VTVPVATLTASLIQVVPFERKKLPLVLGATVCSALVPLPSKTLLAAKVDAPVPPSATAKSVIPEIEPPVMVAPELEKVLATTAPLKVVAPVTDKAEKAPVEAVDAPIGVLLIEPPEITGLVKVLPVRAAPVIVPPVILGAVMVYVPSRIPSPTSLIWDIISRMVSFTPDGNIPSGAPFGGAALLSAGVREYFVYAMIFLDYNFVALF
jgi:hypothetical protein